MIAPAATFSGDWASAISEAISIGTTTPPVPQTSFAERREGADRERREHPADELERERDLEEPAEPTPACPPSA